MSKISCSEPSIQGAARTMSDFEEVEILLAEDSDTDAEMTLRGRCDTPTLLRLLRSSLSASK